MFTQHLFTPLAARECWRVGALVLSAVVLSACVAKDTTSSSTATSSSSVPVSSQTPPSSVAPSSVSSVSSSAVSSAIMVSSSVVMSSSSVMPSSSSMAPASSSLVAMSSSSMAVSSSSSSTDAGPPLVSCEWVAAFNGNNLEVNTFSITNSDTRTVNSWTITLDFGAGNLNGYNNKVYADAAKQIELGTVTREGNSLVLKIEGGMVAPMTVQNIYGFSINPAGISNVPACVLKTKVEGYDDSSGGVVFIPVPQEELDMYFREYACGVGYTALGNGGWPACFRTQDGQAVCFANGQSRVLQWNADKTPVSNVMQVSGMDSDYAVVITSDGAAYQMKTDIGIIPDKDLIVKSGAITVSAGFQSRGCIILDAGAKRDLICTEEKKPWARPKLPEDFDVVQVSASYKMNCALNTKGEVWCWGHPDAATEIITETPSRMPFNEPMVNVSADQTTVCGVSYTGNPKCITDKFVPGYVPGGEPIPNSAAGLFLAEGFEPNAAFFHGAYNRGVVVRKDGTAFYYTKALADAGTGKALGLTDVIAGGGKRDSIVVMTADGNIYAVNDGASKRVGDYKAQNPICPRQ